jgi:hypothetical protein
MRDLIQQIAGPVPLTCHPMTGRGQFVYGQRRDPGIVSGFIRHVQRADRPETLTRQDQAMAAPRICIVSVYQYIIDC